MKVRPDEIAVEAIEGFVDAIKFLGHWLGDVEDGVPLLQSAKNALKKSKGPTAKKVKKRLKKFVTDIDSE
jgi:hypothetical protein